MKEIRFLLFIILSAFFSRSLKAQNDTIKTIQLSDAVVTGQYSPSNTTRSVYKTFVINSAEIEKKASNTLKDILADQLNLRINTEGVLGSSLTLQGIRGENVKVMMDGIPLAGSLDGSIDLSQIPLNNVERIEIVEGPQSVHYGNNALGGVINIITKKDNPNRFSSQTDLYYETAGQYNVNESLSSKIRKKNQLGIQIGRHFFDGFSRPDTNRAQLWKPKETYFSGANYSFHPSRKTDIHLNSHYSYETLLDKGNPYNPEGTLAEDIYYYTQRLTGSADINYRPDSLRNLQFTLGDSYYNRNSHTYIQNLVDLSKSISPNKSTDNTYSSIIGKINYSAPFHKHVMYQTGLEGTFDKGSGERLSKQNPSQINIAAYLSTEIYALHNKLTIRPGLRGTYNSLFSSPLSAAINLKYQLSEFIIIRSYYANGYRGPSIKDLYFDFKDSNHSITGNADLKPESSQNVSLNIDYLRGLGSMIYKFNYSLFFNHIDRFIALVQTDPADPLSYGYRNIGYYVTRGGSIQAELLRDAVSIKAGYAFTAIQAKYLAAEKEIFNSQFNAALNVKIPVFQLGADLIYKYDLNNPYFTIEDKNPKLSRSEPFSIFDASLSRTFLNKRIKIRAGVKNIFDYVRVKTGIESSSNPHLSGGNTLIGMGRTFFINFGFNIFK